MSGLFCPGHIVGSREKGCSLETTKNLESLFTMQRFFKKGLFDNLAVILSISFVLFVDPCHCGSRANYGDYCDNKLIRCNSLATLTCQNNTCLCMKPDSMAYDLRLHGCVSLAGEKCKFTVIEEYRSWHEEVHCVENARCDTVSGLCKCESTYTEYSNGSCVPKGLFGEPCRQNFDCRGDMHLSCIDNECKCDKDLAIYNYDHQQCVGLAEKPCLNDLCTTNALCRGYYGGHSADSYEEYSGEDTRCSCAPGFTMSSKGECQVGHGGLCDFRDSQCLHNFKCRDGMCACRYKDHQTYDDVLKDCYSLVGGPCTYKGSDVYGKESNSTPIYCQRPAVCVQNGKFSQCKCPEGTVESEDRKCDLTFGRICQAEISTKDSKGTRSNSVKCDQLAPLFCIDGRCQCEDDLKIYDEVEKRCRGLVGSSCTLKDNEDSGFCVDGAYCDKYRGSKDKGQCKCLRGYVEATNRTCYTEV